MPCPRSACALPRLMSFSFTQQIVRDSQWILLIVSVRQFWNSLSIVTNVQCQSFCLTLRFWELNRTHPLLSQQRWHWTLFPLPADGCCSFLYQGEAGQDFSVAADSPQIRLHIPKHEIAWFYSYTRLLSHGLQCMSLLFWPHNIAQRKGSLMYIQHLHSLSCVQSICHRFSKIYVIKQMLHFRELDLIKV